MHLSLFHFRGYFSVFYRQLINNSLGNLPSGLFSNLGNLTELYVEIYMYRSLFIVSLTQFISRYIYIYTLILISVPSSEQREKDQIPVWLVAVLKTESKFSLVFFFTLTRAFNKRNPKQGKMTKGSGRDLQHVMIEMLLKMLYFSVA